MRVVELVELLRKYRGVKVRIIVEVMGE